MKERKYVDYDDFLEEYYDVGGIMTDPMPENLPNYNIRKLLKYCEEIGVEPDQLSDEVRDSFIRPRKNVAKS